MARVILNKRDFYNAYFAMAAKEDDNKEDAAKATSACRV